MKKVFFTLILTLTFVSTLISCTTVSNEYSLYRENGKYGLIDEKREVVLPAEFDEITENEVYLCQKKDGESYVYDDKVNLLHTFSSEQKDVQMCSPTLFYYKEGNVIDLKYYVLDIVSKEVFSISFNMIEGNISIEPWVASRTSFYSKDMQQASKFYGRVYPYRENRAVIVENWDGNSQIIDENFAVIVDKIYASADYYSEGLIPVILNGELNDAVYAKPGKSCYLDLNGNVVYECDFDFDYVQRGQYNSVQVPLVIGSFVEDVAVVKAKTNQWFILDRDFNKHYLPEGYEVESYSYSNGLLLVSKLENKQRLYGFVDKECNLVIPCEFSYAEPFDGKYAIVEKDGKDAVIDREGKVYYCDEF